MTMNMPIAWLQNVVKYFIKGRIYWLDKNEPDRLDSPVTRPVAWAGGQEGRNAWDYYQRW